MAILARCPTCKDYRSANAKLCKCGEDLDKAKRSKRVRYWITYRDADGKQKKRSLKSLGLNPSSIEDARDNTIDQDDILNASEQFSKFVSKPSVAHSVAHKGKSGETAITKNP